MNDVSVVALVLVLIGACGGGGNNKRPAATKDRAPEREETRESEPEPPPKLDPKQWHAKAALGPAKGTKLKPAIVSFSQREGEDTAVECDQLDGAKPGTYWLVVHDGDTCGADAAKAGPPWPGASDTKMKIIIGKDLTGGLESDTVPFALSGDTGAVGHVLVLHEDKKGKPGKALACGTIEEVDE